MLAELEGGPNLVFGIKPKTLITGIIQVMRNEKGQFIKGTTGNPLGRPKRADEQFLVDLWSEHGQTDFSSAVQNNERWALKALIDKLYPNQKAIESITERDILQPLLVQIIGK